jgi:hypothetical protein
MGIYTSGKVFGIRICRVLTDDIISMIFEQKQDVELTDDQKREAYAFYSKLNVKENVRAMIYTETSSTHERNSKPYMQWHPIPMATFVSQFSV